MSGQTTAEKLAEVKTRLALYLTAEAAILTHGESYSIGDRSLTRVDLAEIKSEIKNLQNQCDRLEKGSLGATVNYIIPGAS